jgi:hypothetical protein
MQVTGLDSECRALITLAVEQLATGASLDATADTTPKLVCCEYIP